MTRCLIPALLLVSTAVLADDAPRSAIQLPAAHSYEQLLSEANSRYLAAGQELEAMRAELIATRAALAKAQADLAAQTGAAPSLAEPAPTPR